MITTRRTFDGARGDTFLAALRRCTLPVELVLLGVSPPVVVVDGSARPDVVDLWPAIRRENYGRDGFAVAWLSRWQLIEPEDCRPVYLLRAACRRPVRCSFRLAFDAARFSGTVGAIGRAGLVRIIFAPTDPAGLADALPVAAGPMPAHFV